MKPIFFENPAAWRAWLAVHHRTAPEVLVGFHKRHTGRPSLTWPESVDEALCYGWIDGVRRSLGDESYTIRFTPRRDGSAWSAVNIRRVGELIKAKRMRAAGLAAWNRRRDDRPGYSYGQAKTAKLPPALARRLKANAKAWAFYASQPPYYRRLAAWWVIGAKREETKERRFATLVKDCEAGRRIGPMRYDRRGGTRRKPSK